MLRYFLIPVLLLAACLAAAPAYAGCSNPTGNEADRIYNSDYQTLQFCNGTNWVPFGAYQAYVGPGDIVSGATAWYGLRAYSNAVAVTGTQKAINIRRASDNTTKDILIRKSGNLDTPTAATFCASTTCYVTEWYDQSGNGYNALQATTTNQPTLSFNCLGALSCITFSAASATQDVAATIGTTIAQPYTFSVVAQRSSNFTTEVAILQIGSSATPKFDFANSANHVVAYAANSFPTATAADATEHTFQVVFNGNSSSVYYIDGTSTAATNVGTGSLVGTSGLGIGGRITNTGGLYGNIAEAGIWPSAFSSANQSSMCHNQYAYWGTSTAC